MREPDVHPTTSMLCVSAARQIAGVSMCVYEVTMVMPLPVRPVEVVQSVGTLPSSQSSGVDNHILRIILWNSAPGPAGWWVSSVLGFSAGAPPRGVAPRVICEKTVRVNQMGSGTEHKAATSQVDMSCVICLVALTCNMQIQACGRVIHLLQQCL
eukprot:scpid14608/ scgid17259/ 